MQARRCKVFTKNAKIVNRRLCPAPHQVLSFHPNLQRATSNMDFHTSRVCKLLTDHPNKSPHRSHVLVTQPSRCLINAPLTSSRPVANIHHFFLAALCRRSFCSSSPSSLKSQTLNPIMTRALSFRNHSSLDNSPEPFKKNFFHPCRRNISSSSLLLSTSSNAPAPPKQGLVLQNGVSDLENIIWDPRPALIEIRKAGQTNPLFHKMIEKHIIGKANVSYYILDSEKNAELFEALALTATPALYLLHNGGKQICSVVGNLPEDPIEKVLQYASRLESNPQESQTEFEIAMNIPQTPWDEDVQISVQCPSKIEAVDRVENMVQLFVKNKTEHPLFVPTWSLDMVMVQSALTDERMPYNGTAFQFRKTWTRSDWTRLLPQESSQTEIDLSDFFRTTKEPKNDVILPHMGLVKSLVKPGPFIFKAWTRYSRVIPTGFKPNKNNSSKIVASVDFELLSPNKK